jgi:hypothetical protein
MEAASGAADGRPGDLVRIFALFLAAAGVACGTSPAGPGSPLGNNADAMTEGPRDLDGRAPVDGAPDAVVDAGSVPSALVADGGPRRDDAGLPLCGATGCDLRTSTCCLGESGLTITGQCVAHGVACPPLTASFGCLSVGDCSSGSVCCGDVTSTAAETACQTPSGDSCPGVPAAQGVAQLCESGAECRNGMPCVRQRCATGGVFATLSLCGLMPGPPFNCVAR